jgi:hypothetical protein
MIGGVHLTARRGEDKGGAAGGVSLCGRRQSGRAPPTRVRPGQDGEMGWPRGRGPEGRGGAAGWREEKNEWAVAGPKGRMGRKRWKKFFSE